VVGWWESGDVWEGGHCALLLAAACKHAYIIKREIQAIYLLVRWEFLLSEINLWKRLVNISLLYIEVLFTIISQFLLEFI